MRSQRLRWRGITLSAVPQNWGKPGEPVPAGVYVVGIENAEAGKKLGIKQGSIITRIAGHAIEEHRGPPEVHRFHAAGERDAGNRGFRGDRDRSAVTEEPAAEPLGSVWRPIRQETAPACV